MFLGLTSFQHHSCYCPVVKSFFFSEGIAFDYVWSLEMVHPLGDKPT